MNKNNKFYKRLIIEDPINSQKIQNMIAEIEKLSGMWTAGIKLAPQILSILKKSTIITSAGASTRIEGSKLSDKEIEKLFSTGLRIKKFSTRDEQEVAGYKELLENVFNSFESIKFSESTIKHFHKELLKYSEKDKKHLGEYKFGDNKVVAQDSKGNTIGIIFEPTKPYLTSKEMQELVEWTEKAFEEKIFHPLLVIANFIIEFLKIHPFQDGNGRSSRVLTNFLMLKYGYSYMPYISHEKLIEDNKDKYYLALNKSQKSKDYNIALWIIFFLEIILEQVKLAVKLGDKERVEIFLSPKQLQVWQFIQEKRETTPREIRESLSMATATALQVLNKLVEIKKIERLGEGRSTRYRIIE
ncbi:Fic family protein [Patescibacteria group bacterium]|nr:Fic family protein [Patescibacteria group bacterium]